MLGWARQLDVSWWVTGLCWLFVAAILMLGIGRSDDAFLDSIIGDQVVIDARIADDPTITGAKVNINLANAIIYSNKRQHAVTGRMWVSLKNPKQTTHRYDTVRLSGILNSGFGGFVATVNNSKIISIRHDSRSDPLGGLRDMFASYLDKLLNKNQAGLGMGLIAGQKTAMEQSFVAAFIASSLTHILVASGYNLTILTRFCRRWLARYSRLIALMLSSTAVILFAGIVGGSASMMRAVAVSLLSLAAWYVGRNFHPITLLSIVCVITLVIDPSQIWGDVGWYLSFASFAGVLILAPLINDFFRIQTRFDSEQMARTPRLQRYWHSIRAIIVETCSAQLVSWPIIALAMGKVPIIGLLSNLLVLPFVPLAMLLTFVAGLAGWILPVALARIVAWPASIVLSYILSVAQWAADLPMSTITYVPSGVMIAVYYLGLVVLCLFLWRRTGHNFRRDNVIE